ncbi:MAG: hypothetical protein M1837_005240 [Sclerophora amabilis]|nr:MAG: hypothetical protein M1837_005240 [Sclerophora amabilis]
MSLRQLDLTTALRPSLLPDEVLLFVQDGVGLYDGKFKIPDFQNGQAYLTSHRACYVDNDEPRKSSVAVELKGVDRYEFYAGFLKSSPKVTFYPKPLPRGSTISRASPASGVPSHNGTGSPSLRGESPFRIPSPSAAASTTQNATWICAICSFSNPVPSNFDPATANENTPLPPCLTCGISPQFSHVLKAAITNASKRQPTTTSAAAPQPLVESHNYAESSSDVLNAPYPRRGDFPQAKPKSTLHCPRCTFLNHPSLITCEICGAPLPGSNASDLIVDNGSTHRSESPGPLLAPGAISEHEAPESVKFSFRAGGEKIFYERLKGAMVQRKWLLQGAPPVPRPSGRNLDEGGVDDQRQLSPHTVGGLPGSEQAYRSQKTVGIASLEQRGFQVRRNNELVIGTAFEDLEALMTSAKEIITLAESFAGRINAASGGGGGSSSSSEATALLSHSAAALGLATTKDMLGSGSTSESLYLSELSRNLAEFLTDDSTGVLRREGGIMSLVDLWAVFNRARGGVELVSPTDFEKAANLWQTLKMPIRLRKFRSGLMVVQGKDWTDERTIASLLSWLKTFHEVPPEGDVLWDWNMFGRGVTPQETAERFGWSVGVASEELEMAEERGVLCREESVEGLRFWENWIASGHDVSNTAEGSLRVLSLQ